MNSAQGATPVVDQATPPERRSSWLAYTLLAALAASVLLPGLGSYGLWDPAEAWYAQSAREMLEQRAPFTPSFAGEEYRPGAILTYWGILAGFLIFGAGELGARIGGVLATAAAVAVVFYGVSRLKGRRAALLAGVVLLTAPQAFLLARHAIPPVYLSTTLGSALVLLALGLLRPEDRRQAHLTLSYLCLALAMLAAGPLVPGVIYLGTLAVYGWTRFDPDALGVRDAAARAGRQAAPLLAAAIVFGMLLSVFGVASRRWDGLGGMRTTVLQARQSLHDGLLAGAATRGLLALVAALGLGLALRSFRKSEGRLTFGWIAGAGLALVGIALPSLGGRAAILGAAGIALCCTGLAKILTDLCSSPNLGPSAAGLRFFLRQSWVAVAILIAVVGPWLLVVGLADDGLGFEDAQWAEASRSKATGYYLRPLIYGLFPWSCFLPVALAWSFGSIDPRRLREHALELLMWVAAAIGFAAVAVALPKAQYLLAPLIVPLAVVVGSTLDGLLDRRDPVVARLGWTVAAMLYLPVMLDLLHEDAFESLLALFTRERDLPDEFVLGQLFPLLLMATALVLLLSIVWRTRWNAVALAVLAVLLAHQSAVFVVPEVAEEKSVKALCQAWAERRRGDEPLGLFGRVPNSAYFYCGELLPLEGRSFQDFLAVGSGAHALVRRSRLSTLRDLYRRDHPGHQLAIIDIQHPDYALVASE